MGAPPPAQLGRWSWRRRAWRGLVYQGLALLVLALGLWFLGHHTLANMRERGIQSGLDFLWQTAGFDIGESLLTFESSQSYFMAFAVGLLNTLRVALLGCVLATVLGTLVGVGRLSRSALLRGLCQAYVECFRNVPLLLQLLMWYLLFTELLPDAAQAWQLGPVFLSKGGLSFPVPLWVAGHAWGAAGLLAGGLAGELYRRRARAQDEAAGRMRRLGWVPLLSLLAGGLLGWLLGGAPTAADVPVRGEFAIENGGALTPEFMALLLGLVAYTAAFVAEVVRSGLQSVPRGQSEAAAALGLSRAQEMRLVQLPLALRVIIPPMTNQYLNLTKNSSLAVAIGYPDVVSIANTAINQTGRAVECIFIVMLVYLLLSLATSGLMNRYNARAAIRER